MNESNLDKVTLNWNGIDENMNCIGTSPIYYCSITKSGLIAGNNYTFQVKVNNTNGLSKTLNSRQIFIVSIPELFLNQPPSPISNEIINTNYTLIDFNLNETTNLSSFVDFNRSLKVYYNFEDVSGTTVYDLSSYGVNGILKNNPIIDIVNKIRGKYLYLDGSNDYVDVNNLDLNLSSGAKTTVEFWMYWDGVQSSMPVGLVGSNYDLYFSGGNFGFNTGASDIYGFSSIGLANSWHHIVTIFYNGQVNNINNAIYVDGVKQVISQKAGTSGSKSVTNNFLISGWGASSGYKFGGKIDEFKIWEGELSPELINLSYNSEKINYQFNFTNLIQGDQYNYKVCTTNFYGLLNCTNRIQFKYDLINTTKKDVKIFKNITSINTNQYLVQLEIKNYLNQEENVSLSDFVDNSFNVGSFSLNYNSTNSVVGFYNGSIYNWNLSLNPYQNISINYSIVGVGDYKLSENILIGLE